MTLTLRAAITDGDTVFDVLGADDLQPGEWKTIDSEAMTIRTAKAATLAYGETARYRVSVYRGSAGTHAAAHDAGATVAAYSADGSGLPSQWTDSGSGDVTIKDDGVHLTETTLANALDIVASGVTITAAGSTGSAGQPLVAQGDDSIEWDSDIILDTLTVGPTPAQFGAVRIGNGANNGIWARNNANLGEFALLAGNGADEAELRADARFAANAFNHIRARGASTGNSPILEAIGNDTDVGLELRPQGAGKLRSNGAQILTFLNGADLPTVNPGVSGALWNDSGTVKVVP